MFDVSEGGFRTDDFKAGGSDPSIDVTRAMADAKHAAPHIKVIPRIRRLSLKKAAIAFGYRASASVNNSGFENLWLCATGAVVNGGRWFRSMNAVRRNWLLVLPLPLNL
jgi:hypothetical protein